MRFPELKLPRWPKGEPEPAGAIPLSLVRSAKAASWIAYFCLVYFLWLYTLDIARDRSASLHMTHVGFWSTEGPGLLFWFPYIIGFAVIAVGIPYVAKIAIPTFMSLDWRGNAWPKGWALFIACSVSLVVFAGTFTIQGDAILEKGREAAVAVSQVEQSKAVLQSRIAAKEAELKSMMENRNAYLAQAASVGAVEWQRSYIDQTPAGDVQRDRIVRALGAARAADAVRADLVSLRAEAATQTTTAAVSERVEARAGVSWIGSAIDWIQGARAILLSLVMDIVALLMPWIALRLEQARGRQIGESVADVMMIEDHSAEAMPEAQPYTQAKEQREQFFDEDGNKIVRRKATWAKVPTKKANRKTLNKNGGKLEADATEYEAPAKSVRLNEESEDAGQSAESGVVNDKVAEQRSALSVVDIQSLGQASSADDASRPQEHHADEAPLTPIEPEEEDAGASNEGSSLVEDADEVLAEVDTSTALSESKESDLGAAEPESSLVSEADAPAIQTIDDARFDEMIERGEIDEEGNPLPQDNAEVIRQPTDEEVEQWSRFAANRGLPAPKREEAA